MQHGETSSLKHTVIVILNSLLEKQALCSTGPVIALTVPDATC